MSNNPLGDLLKNLQSVRPVIPNIKTPSFELPKRGEDCPAAPICSYIGNARRGCFEGATLANNANNLEKCFASLIMIFGVHLIKDKDFEEVKKRVIGFKPRDDEEA